MVYGALLLAGSIAAAQQAPACRPVPGLGCYLERPGAQALIVYHRGHLTRRLPGERFLRGGNPMPDAVLPISAADAVAQYNLADAAAALDASLLVVGQSHLPVDLKTLPSWLSVPKTLYVAAHSGGYYGLADSLAGYPRIEGLALLDCFYGVEDGRLKRIGEETKRRVLKDGMHCGAFYNDEGADARYRLIFAPAMGSANERCPAEKMSVAEHEKDLQLKLARYVRPKLPKTLGLPPEVGQPPTGPRREPTLQEMIMRERRELSGDFSR